MYGLFLESWMKENTWKVVYIASRQEKKVAQKLALLNIECFLPLYRKLSQWSDRKKWVELPLFNGYLFVKPDEFQRDAVLSQHGVVAFVRYNGEDAKVQDEEIETIKTILTSGYSLETINTPEDFKLGESVLVNEGPLKGQKVDIIRRNNEEEVLVSFDTLGQSIKISLPYHIFRKAN